MDLIGLTPAASVASAPKSGWLSMFQKDKSHAQEPQGNQKSISPKKRLAFYDQLATLLESGITLVDSLTLILAQEKNKHFRQLCQQTIHNINRGISLSSSMALFPNAFPKMQVALVEAGEKSGNLKNVLLQMTEEMEASEDFLRKIKGAMFYPLLLLFLALALATGMIAFVIPKVAAMYQEASVSLPAFTQAVIDLSDFVVAEWRWILIGAAGGMLLLWIVFGKVRLGRLALEKILFSFPIIGQIYKQKQLMVISGNMAMLLKSGVLISQAFEISEKTLNNLHYQKAMTEIRQGVTMGKEVSQMMGLEDLTQQKFKEHPLFPLQMAQMMHIGETTGTLPKMLEKAKQGYHKNIDYRLKNISVLVEPIMIFFIAAIVGSILLAVMLPFFYIGNTIS